MLQTAIPDALQALMVLAQQANPTTPSGQPTVAAQLAQANAAQQGIPQAVENFEDAAPSVMRNMQQDQLQQMLRQAAQPQPAGIEGLPAPNMRFAEGGVIGFAGPDGSEVPEAETPFGRAVGRLGKSFSEQNEASRLRNLLTQKYGPASALPGLFMTQTDAQRQYAKEIMRMLPTMSVEQMRNLLGQTPPRAVSADAFQEAGPGETGMPVASPAEAPERLRDTRAIPASAARPAGAAPAPVPARPPAQPAAAAAAAQPPTAAILGGGIAQGMPPVPTLGGAMAEVERTMPGTGTEASRKALEELQRMRRERPESGLASLKALEAEAQTAAELKRKMDESAKSRALDAWLSGGSRLGGSGRAVAAFRDAENRRQTLFAQENTIRVAKMDAIKDANEARRIGDQEKYVEALNKLAELDRADKQVKAQLAAQTVSAQTTARGQDITAATAAADREAAAQRLERQITAQASEGKLDRESRMKIAEIAQRGAETPAEVRLMEWLKKPENKALYEEVSGIRQAPKTRQELMKEWSSNIMLQQRYPNMEDYVRAGMAAAGANTGIAGGRGTRENPIKLD